MVIGVKDGLEYSGFVGNRIGCWASVDIKINQESYKILSIYNNTTCDKMRNELDGVLGQSLGKMCKTIIGGDLNARIGALGAIVEGEDRDTEDGVTNKEGD